MYSSAIGGHSRERVSYQKLKQIFFWPNMKAFINDKIASCPTYQISKIEKVAYPGLLEPLKIHTAKWSEISMDFIECLPTSK
jgi:hypothetical protein